MGRFAAPEMNVSIPIVKVAIDPDLVSPEDAIFKMAFWRARRS